MDTTLFETERLTVRRLEEDDLLPFHDMQRNPNVMQYIKPPMTLAESTTELHRFIRYYADEQTFFRIWAVEEQSSRTFVGICGVYTNRHNEYEIAYRLRECFWHRGFGKEIAQHLFQYCLGTLGLEEIVAYVSKANAGSVRILEQLMEFVDEFYSEEEQSVERKYRLV